MADEDQKTVKRLISGCQQGDSLAQKQLYEKYFGLLLGVCLRYANEREEAKDILQEGFVKIFNNIKAYQDTGSLEGWMKTIVINTAIDRYRKKVNEPFSVNIENVEEPAMPAEAYDELDQQTLLKAMQELPEGYRTVFNLYVIEGYSHKEIAEQFEINEGTSKSQLAKARNMLKEKLKDFVPDSKTGTQT